MCFFSMSPQKVRSYNSIDSSFFLTFSISKSQSILIINLHWYSNVNSARFHDIFHTSKCMISTHIASWRFVESLIILTDYHPKDVKIMKEIKLS